jgi:hypothetical protein
MTKCCRSILTGVSLELLIIASRLIDGEQETSEYD